VTSTKQSNKNPLLNFHTKIFYGWWIIVLALIITSSTQLPVTSGVGIWLDSFEQHFGWSRTQLALAISIGQLETSLAAPIVGILIDKIGAKRLVFSGISVVGIGFILLSQTDSLTMFYISYAVVMLGSLLGGRLPMMAVINNWFDKKRTIAMGMGGLGSSVGSFVVIPILALLVNPTNFGWEMTSMGLGIFFLVIALPIAKLIRNSPEEHGEIPDGIKTHDPEITNDDINENDNRDFTILEVMKMKSFWVITICLSTSSMIGSTMMVHMILALTDQGLPLTTSALIWGITMGIAGLGQILGGYIGDRIPKNLALFIFGCLQSLGVLLAIVIANNLYIIAIFVIIYGLGYGARSSLGAAIRGEYFGRKSFGKVMGFSMLPMRFTMFVGPLFAGKMFDTYGNYDYAFLILAAITGFGSLGFFLAKKPKSKSSLHLDSQ
jgi:MFS family permease